ncbi:NAD(P)-dependent oxidoreductase [Thiovibrio sp. JS02]
MGEKIGFIGLGIMGRLMAANLLRKGHAVMVYNRTAGKSETLAALGAEVAKNPAEIGSWAESTILMLTGPEAITAVLEGPDGFLATCPPGRTLINMSTVSPDYSRALADRLREKDLTLLDAPVSGSKKPAEEGTLVILASGPQEIVRTQEALFLAMGKKVVYCGEAGMGSAMKMAINLLLGIMMEGLCEAVAFGERCGLAPELLLDTILAGPLGCGLYGLKTEMLKTNTFPPQFPLKHMAKDINFVVETARDRKAQIPVGEAVAALYNLGLGKGLGEEDFAAVKKLLAKTG